MKKRIAAILGLLLLGTGCTSNTIGGVPGASSVPAAAYDTPKVYALVVKNIENPYMQTMYDGFENACNEVGATAQLWGPGESGEPTQSQIIEELISQGVDAIAIAANDMDDVLPGLEKAMEAGIPVVSLDSVVRPQARIVHIQQASPEMIGRVLIQACAQMMDGEGEFAILTTTDTMPNQASWLSWMLQELEDHPDAYANMALVDTAYGLDDPTASADAARALLAQYADLKAIIALTVVGMRVTAEEIVAAGSPVKLTGLGLPSEMEPYILQGVCPWMYLWNPSEVGYLAAYAINAIILGELTGAAGETIVAGELGYKIVVDSTDGGTEIVLGNPKVFDAANVTAWGELF